MPAGGQAVWRTCLDGTRIRVAVWKGGGDKTVLIFPGRTEFIEKYGDVVARFLDRNFSVAVIDWRGQGLADKHPTRPMMGWVRDFSNYQQDVAEMLATVDAFGLPKPFAMVGHSMGGAIGLRALLNGLDVEKAIFSAPMWGILVAPHLKIAAGLVASVGPHIGFGQKFIPTGAGKHYVLTQPFEGNTLTNDRDAYKVMQSHIRAHPELGLGAPSVRWYSQAIKETRAICDLAPAQHDTLTFLGSNEAIVEPASIKSVMGKWPNGKLVELDQAQHEVLMEEPHILTQVWAEIDAHLGE